MKHQPGQPDSINAAADASADGFPYRLLFEHANDAVFISDLNDRILDANRAACRLYGYERDELLTMRINDLQAPERRAPAGTVIREEIDRYGGRTFETVDIRKDGQRVHVEVTTTLIQTARGELALSIARDITDRKATENALRSSEDELRRLNVELEQRVQRRTAELEQSHARQAELAHVARLSTMGEMASGLAHELNQPLAAIVNYGGGILRRIETGDDAASIGPAVQRVVAQALRAAEIIRRLREFVTKRGLQRESADLNQLILGLLPLIQPEASTQNIEITTRLAPDLPRLVVDTIQIEQVLVNLVLNAIEAIAGVLPGHPTRPGLIEIVSFCADGQVRLEVRDNGPGLPDAYQVRLFDPFFTTKVNGMGMGLTISQSIVEAHGGRLFAEDSAAGTAFCICLPVQAPPG